MEGQHGGANGEGVSKFQCCMSVLRHIHSMRVLKCTHDRLVSTRINNEKVCPFIGIEATRVNHKWKIVM